MKKKARRRLTTAARIRSLQRRVLILEKNYDGIVTKCQLELDTRLKAVERTLSKVARDTATPR